VKVKVKNPKYKGQVELFISANRSSIDSFFSGLPDDQEHVSVRDIETAFSLLMVGTKKVEDGLILEVLQELDYEVVME